MMTGLYLQCWFEGCTYTVDVDANRVWNGGGGDVDDTSCGVGDDCFRQLTQLFHSTPAFAEVVWNDDAHKRIVRGNKELPTDAKRAAKRLNKMSIGLDAVRDYAEQSELCRRQLLDQRMGDTEAKACLDVDGEACDVCSQALGAMVGQDAVLQAVAAVPAGGVVVVGAPQPDERGSVAVAMGAVPVAATPVRFFGLGRGDGRDLGGLCVLTCSTCAGYGLIDIGDGGGCGGGCGGGGVSGV
jgi:hypothetical protein